MLKKSAMPLYHQLRLALSEKIESGEWKSGYQLPPENALVEEFGVSRATVRQAMQFLENQGLVERIQGRGTFVARPKLTGDLLSPWILPSDSALRIDFTYLKVATPPKSISERLKLPPTEKTYELKRVVFVDKEPIMVITSWLPHNLFAGLEAKDLHGIPIKEIVSSYFALEGIHQHKEVEITILDENEGDLMGVESGAPALLVTYLNHLSDGRAFEYRKMIVRGDRFKYYIDMEIPDPLV